MDISYKYVNEYVEDGEVKSAENESNILTKNVSAELHKKHSQKMVGQKLKKGSSFTNI